MWPSVNACASSREYRVMAKRESREACAASWSAASSKGYVNCMNATGGRYYNKLSWSWGDLSVGWQVAADGNTSETMYPDQSL